MDAGMLAERDRDVPGDGAPDGGGFLGRLRLKRLQQAQCRDAGAGSLRYLSAPDPVGGDIIVDQDEGPGRRRQATRMPKS